jgi:prevent-host-death family protein
VDDIPQKPKTSETTVGAYEAKTRFSELIARAQHGESFTVTKNGKAVARITPVMSFDRERARLAGERIRELASRQGPRVSEEKAQRNWEELKADIERDWDERIDRWLKS